MEQLPAPPAKFKAPAQLHECAASTRLTRLYFRGGPHPGFWSEFRRFGPTSSRFDHHLPPPRLQDREVLYATTGAGAFQTALAEVFQETRHIDRKRHDPWLVVFDLRAPVRLLDTSGVWPVSAGGNMAINSGERARSRAWARVIYDSYPDAQGIWYPSSMTNHHCVVFFERAKSATPAHPMFNEALASPKLLPGILACADALGYTVS